MKHPFSDEELLSALRLVLPESEARRTLDAINAPPEKLGTASGTNLTDDLLDLLASMSPDLSRRVAEYRERGLARQQRFRERYFRKHEEGG